LDNLKLKISPPLGGYLFVFFVALFGVCFLFYIEKVLLALLLFVFAFLSVLMLSITDKIVFDGQSISRTGIFPRLWAYINGRKTKISVDSINQVETSPLLTLRKAKRVSFTYKTMICSFESRLIFISSENNKYRAFLKALVSAIHREVLDFASLELSKYATNQEEVLAEARALKLFPEHLRETLRFDLLILNNRNDETQMLPNSDETLKVKRLRKVANELKILGYLPQAIEAFRRALTLKPKDAWLCFEYALCLQLFAESEKDQESAKKAKRYLRLSRIYGKDNAEILTYIAETYLKNGDLNEAKRTFHMVLEKDAENYRAFLGLAETALREGKVARVIHYLMAAQRITRVDALREWISREIAYFSRLNSDLTYMEKEISRVSWLEKIHFGKKLAVWAFLMGFPFIVLGSFYEQSLGAIGWTLSAFSILSWIGLNASASFLTQRTPL
jgi:tetratricopeptide (TPR) repeat protein